MRIMAPMVGTIQALMVAVTVFVGGHFFLSSVAVRGPVIKALGVNGFRLAYSALALGGLAWTIVAYSAAPHNPLWADSPGLRHLPLLVMPFACILLVCGLTTQNVTMLAGEKYLEGPRPLWGIVTVTRHPFLWGTGLWAVAHFLANGDEASVILFGGMAILSFGGMAHIDMRRRAAPSFHLPCPPGRFYRLGRRNRLAVQALPHICRSRNTTFPVERKDRNQPCFHQRCIARRRAARFF